MHDSLKAAFKLKKKCKYLLCKLQDVYVSGEKAESAAKETEKAEENFQTVELPEQASLPSEGVEYTSLEEEKVKDMVDRLTTNVYEKIRV